MLQIFKRTLLIGLLSLQAFAIQAQPFKNEIDAFKKKDSVSFPPKNAILLVGSSSFRKWTDVQDYFPKYHIINRGFGGSMLPDVIRYADDVIFPYQPKQILIYCGDNDLASSDTVTAAMVIARFKTLFELIRARMPDVPIGFVSIKPSPTRLRLASKMEEANNGIKEFLKTKKKTSFIDVYHKMLDKDGAPMKDIFLEDNLHMNAKGYAIWQKVIQPYLLKSKK
ncbi:MAG: GDSL-type esterase/lipase family protein [Chitinophagaceae bacterium]